MRSNTRTEGLPLKGQSPKQYRKMLEVQQLLKSLNSTEAPPRFDAVVGNPPYQQVLSKAAGRSSRTISIFPDFQRVALLVARYSSLIYPIGRWWFNEKSELYRELLTEGRLRSLRFYPHGGTVNPFSKVAIIDGTGVVFAVTDTADSNATKDDSNFNNTQPLARAASFELIDELGVSTTVNFRGEVVPLNSRVAEEIRLITAKGYPTLAERGSLRKNEAGVLAKDIAAVAAPWTGQELQDNEIKYYGTATSFIGSKAGIYVIPRRLLKRAVDENYKVAFGESILENHKCSWRVLTFSRGVALGNAAVRLAAFATEEEQHNFSLYARTVFFENLLRASIEGRMRKLGYFVPDLGDYTNENPLFQEDPTIEELDNRLREHFGTTTP